MTAEYLALKKYFAEMEKINPFERGSEIFKSIFSSFTSDIITEKLELENLLNQVLVETNGWVISDFLDGGNWDCLGSYEIDQENNFLLLHWHEYVNNFSIEGYINQEKIKPYIESVILKFKDCRIGFFHEIPFIAIRGYAIKDKEVISYLKERNDEVESIKELSKNFYSLYKTDNERFSSEYYCLNSPVYSFLIIPKDTDTTSNLSQNLLFLCNYIDCIYRLNKIQTSLSENMNEDDLSSKGNLIRKIFENILKIECSFHAEANEKYWFDPNSPEFAFKKDYSDLQLGDLFKILKYSKLEHEKTDLNDIIRRLNDLSHDSGKPVFYNDVNYVLEKVVSYTKTLADMLTFRM